MNTKIRERTDVFLDQGNLLRALRAARRRHERGAGGRVLQIHQVGEDVYYGMA